MVEGGREQRTVVTTAGNGRSRRAALSQTDIPTFPLTETLRVPRALSDHLGKNPSPPLQVAAAMGMQPTTGKFRALTGASIAYGLTEGGSNAESIKLTDLGRRAVAPTVEGDDIVAMRQAILTPRVTREFLERYNGSKWPKDDIGQNVLQSMGVPPERTDEALNAILTDARALDLLLDINGDTYVTLTPPAAGAAHEPGALTAPSLATARDGGTTENGGPFAELAAPPPVIPPVVTQVQPPNNRVFITHGKNTAIVRQIKELLTFGGFHPVVAAENQTAAKPVPEKVMDDMRSCAAGIVHVGSEQKMIDADGNEQQMLNPNVLIEIGAAMALYGNKFILLVEKGTTLPSNLQGLYEVRYQGAGLDYEATMSLLKAFSDFRSEAVDSGEAA